MHQKAHWFHPWDNITRFIIGFNGVANVALGLSFLLWANVSAEGVLSQYFSPHLWPVLWILAGLIGVGGLWSITLARFSFVLCGVVMGVFTLASMWAVVAEGRLVAIPTTVFLLYITILLLCIASLIRQRDNLVRQVQDIADFGQQKLDEVKDA